VYAPWLIVGAGFSGSTLAERIASQLDQKVILIDRRSHIGGNAYDQPDEHGILIHRYGPHIFHTNSRKVWDYLSAFTDWRHYEHHVLAVVDGKKIPVPFNLNSLDAMFAPAEAARLERLLIERFGADARTPILNLRQDPDPAIRELGEFVYQKIFHGYTVKQWELTPEELDPLVTGRVPVRISRDDRYFQDVWQYMPREGYTALFQRMLTHPNITVLTGVSLAEAEGEVRYDRVIFTGPVDEFFAYTHGPLPYRSLRFEFRTLEQEWFQETGTVNYPNDQPWTRITEQKYLSGQTGPKTTIVVEYPQAHVAGVNEPYYPIPRPQNRALYERYAAEAERLDGRVLFAGRLGDYKYYNMDQAVARALKVFEDGIAGCGERGAA